MNLNANLFFLDDNRAARMLSNHASALVRPPPHLQSAIAVDATAVATGPAAPLSQPLPWPDELVPEGP